MGDGASGIVVGIAVSLRRRVLFVKARHTFSRRLGWEAEEQLWEVVIIVAQVMMVVESDVRVRIVEESHAELLEEIIGMKFVLADLSCHILHATTPTTATATVMPVPLAEEIFKLASRHPPVRIRI